MGEALGVFVIFAVLVIWEIERIRKDTTRMRIIMETQQSKWRETCNEIVSLSRLLEKEIMDGRDRRVQEASRE